MYEAWVGAIGGPMSASDYEDLSSEDRQVLADSLVCTECRQPAYFVRRARNGRAACFGARPHLEGCAMASSITEDGGTAALVTDEPRVSAKDQFTLRSVSAGNKPVKHVAHDPTAVPGDGRARRYAGRGDGGTARPSMGLGVLLRRLIREPKIRTSKAKLALPDGAGGQIRKYCVEVIDADLSFQNKKLLYWGTIRYANDDDEGGAWLNLGRRGGPSLHLSSSFLAALLSRHGIKDLEDLQGASFLCYLPLKKAIRSDRLFLFPNDLDWFALRLADEDPV